MKIELTSRDFMLLLLILIGLVLILEANVSLRAPIIFGDEGFHAGLSKWIVENKEYPKWGPLGYTNVFKIDYARPPLFHILGAGFLFLLGKHEIALKILPSLLGALIGIVFYLLVKRLYDKEISFISTLILVGLPSFVTYTVLFFDEILFVFYMMLFIFTFMLAVKENNRKFLILSAIFGALAILTKMPGMLVLVFVPIAFLYVIFKEKNLRQNLKLFVLFMIIVVLISGPYFLRNFAYYNVPTCYIPFGLADTSGCFIKEFEEVRKFETRSLAGGTESNILTFGLVNYVNFAYGNFWLFMIGLVGGIAVFLSRKNEKTRFFIFLMMAFSSYVIYSTFNRVEDLARQVLFWSALLIVISATYWAELYKTLNKLLKFLGIFVVVVLLFFSYQNIKLKLDVMENVKQFSPAFFEACGWVKENLPKDVIIMTFWGHRAAYSCERTVSPGWADIRLNDDPDDMLGVIKMHGITHLFIQKFSITQQPSRESYSVAFVQLLEDNPNKFGKIYENGPELSQCLQAGGCDGNIIYKVIY